MYTTVRRMSSVTISQTQSPSEREQEVAPATGKECSHLDSVLSQLGRSKGAEVYDLVQRC